MAIFTIYHRTGIVGLLLASNLALADPTQTLSEASGGNAVEACAILRQGIDNMPAPSPTWQMQNASDLEAMKQMCLHAARLNDAAVIKRLEPLWASVQGATGPHP